MSDSTQRNELPEGPPPLAELIDRACDRFEELWKAGPRPSLRQFLGSLPEGIDAPTRRDLLVELVMIDLEHRWRLSRARGVQETALPEATAAAGIAAGLPERPLIEHYLDEFPEIKAQGQVPAVLIAREYHVRHHWGDRPGHSEFLQRFGAGQPAVLAELERIDRQMRLQGQRTELGASDKSPAAVPGGVLRVRCPHCRNPIELVDVSAISGCLHLLRMVNN